MCGEFIFQPAAEIIKTQMNLSEVWVMLYIILKLFYQV